MFLDLFYGLRDEGVPVSIQEWRMLMEALEKGLHGSSLLSFYHLSRATLVKSETYFDAFDRVFARVFHGVEGELSLSEDLEQWLNDPKLFDGLTDEQRAQLQRLDADELMRKFLETLEEQDERHPPPGGRPWNSWTRSTVDPSTGRGTGLRYLLSPFGGRRHFAEDGIFSNAPPWSTLVAVDLNAGEIRWTVPTGVSKSSVRRLFSFGLPLVTAGGLVFHAGNRDLRLRAHDARNGEVSRTSIFRRSARRPHHLQAAIRRESSSW